MVLDNADNVEVFYPGQNHTLGTRSGRLSGTPRPLAAYLPKSHGSILITSRSKDAAARLAGGSKNIKEVQAMNRDQAIQLLQNKLEDATDESSMAEILQVLDHIPLAISQAAAYINRNAPRMTIAKYLDDFWKNDKKRTNLLNRDAGDLRRDESASNSVVTTWQMSFEQVRNERRSAADLLSLMSFFNPQGIPESVLRKHSSSEANISNDDCDNDDDEFDDDLDVLRAYSLVTTADNGVCEMHHLVQFCTRVWLSSFNEVERWRRKFLMLMAREFPDGSFENWIKCQTLLPHVESILQREPADKRSLEDWCKVLSNSASYMWSKGNYQAAEIMATRAMESIEDANNPTTLLSMSILALAWLGQGKYGAAEEMNRRALEGYEEALGKEHPKTLTSMDNLSMVLQQQGKYEEAEKTGWRALEGREKALGKEHPDTLAGLGSLASVLCCQGKYETAEQMNWRVMKGCKKVLGMDHPLMLTGVSELALVLQHQGKYGLAEQMHRRALKGSEKVLGEDHPDTLTTLDNLALVLRYQGKHKVAEEMNERALKGFEKVLGNEHPETLTSMDNLSMVLQHRGKYEEAEKTGWRALEGREKPLGKEHPDTLASLGNLALLLQVQGKCEAEEMHCQTLEGREKAPGKEHPDTLKSVYCLAYLFHQQHRYEAASELYERASSGFLHVLGPEHPETVACLEHYRSLTQIMQHRR